MKPSRYLARFQNLAAEGQEAFQLTGDFILVEALGAEELKTASGIILHTASADKQITALAADKPNWVRVLAVGPGYYDDETKEDVPLDVKPGDIVLLPRVSIKYFSLFGSLNGYEADTIGLANESQIQLKFFGEEGYDKAFSLLNCPPSSGVEPGSGKV